MHVYFLKVKEIGWLYRLPEIFKSSNPFLEKCKALQEFDLHITEEIRGTMFLYSICFSIYQ